MDKKDLRKTGIEILGDAPWGTHVCQFYKTKQDLIDVLVPYFKAGLENNEFCMWVTSEPLNAKEAGEALRGAVPDLEMYLDKGQIEILPYDEWYIKDGVFDMDRVLDGWVDKLNRALSKGYDGLRLTGNTFWLEEKNWDSFVKYENIVNSVIGKYSILAICAYSLERCGASEVMEVISSHQRAMIRKEGKWSIIESAELKKSRQETEKRLHELEIFYKAAVDRELKMKQLEKRIAELETKLGANPK